MKELIMIMVIVGIVMVIMSTVVGRLIMWMIKNLIMIMVKVLIVLVIMKSISMIIETVDKIKGGF